jgi:hypothetical protein
MRGPRPTIRFNAIAVAVAAAGILLNAGIGTAQTSRSDESFSGRRVALVVGNDAYRNVDKLAKAVADARSVAGALERIGFEVILKENTDRRSLNAAIGDFTERLQGAQAGIVFYAGHGVQLEGRNILLPVDVPRLQRASDLLDEGVDLSRVIDRISETGVPYTALIVDACRDNPFPRQGTRSVGATRGLTVVAPPTGLYIAYSAGTNEKALDNLGPADKHPNGLFVRSLLPHLTEPGITLDSAVKRARDRVRDEAAAVRHSQNPAIYDQTRGDLILVPKPVALPAPATPSPGGPSAEASRLPPPAPPPDPGPSVEREAEVAFWRSIAESRDEADFRDYLARYPKGTFASLARRRIKALASPAQEPKPNVAVTAAPQATGSQQREQTTSQPSRIALAPTAMLPLPQPTPANPAGLQAAPAVPAGPAALSAGDLQGKWAGTSGPCRLDVTVAGTRMRAVLIGNWGTVAGSFDATLTPDGQVATWVSVQGRQIERRQVHGTFPSLSLSHGEICGARTFHLAKSG